MMLKNKTKTVNSIHKVTGASHHLCPPVLPTSFHPIPSALLPFLAASLRPDPPLPFSSGGRTRKELNSNGGQ
ncbi:unnamed protein product, partial [Gulo gulo]